MFRTCPTKQHSKSLKLPTAADRAMYRRAVIEKISQRLIACEFGVSQPTVSRVCAKVAAWLASLDPATLRSAALAHESDWRRPAMQENQDADFCREGGLTPSEEQGYAFREKAYEELLDELHATIAKSPFVNQLRRVQVKVFFKVSPEKTPQKHAYVTKLEIQEVHGGGEVVIQHPVEVTPATPPTPRTVVIDVPSESAVRPSVPGGIGLANQMEAGSL